MLCICLFLLSIYNTDRHTAKSLMIHFIWKMYELILFYSNMLFIAYKYLIMNWILTVMICKWFAHYIMDGKMFCLHNKLTYFSHMSSRKEILYLPNLGMLKTLYIEKVCWFYIFIIHNSLYWIWVYFWMNNNIMAKMYNILIIWLIIFLYMWK